MKKTEMSRSLVLALISGFIMVSCTSNKKDYHDVGNVRVNGIQGINFQITQANKFDHSTSVHYAIAHDNGKVISKEHFLFGSSDYLNNSRDFYSNCYDSIIYLTYNDTNEIYAIYDLKIEWGFPHGDISETYMDKIRRSDSLIQILKKFNSSLKAEYKN